MAELIAIGYDDMEMADKAAEEVNRLAQDLVILQGLSKYGGRVLKSSLSSDAEHQLQEALAGAGDNGRTQATTAAPAPGECLTLVLNGRARTRRCRHPDSGREDLPHGSGDLAEVRQLVEHASRSVLDCL